MWADNETEVDLLGFDFLVDTLFVALTEPRVLPVTIGLLGDWGSGKSSLMKITRHELQAVRREGESEPSYLCVEFSPWQYEDYDDVKIALMSTVLDAIGARAGSDQQDKVSRLKRFVQAIGRIARRGGRVGVATAQVAGPIALQLADPGIDPKLLEIAKAATNALATEANKLLEDPKAKASTPAEAITDVGRFRAEFAELVAAVKDLDAVVVFIDDLDRCLPETVVDTFEAIRLFLNTPKTAYVLAANQAVVEAAINSRYPQMRRMDGSGIGSDYLEKMLQLKVAIPPLSAPEADTYVNLLLADLHLDRGQFAKVVEETRRRRNEGNLVVAFNLGVAQQVLGEVPSDLLRDLDWASSITELLGSGLRGNPRQLKRFLNDLLLKHRSAQRRKISLELPVLAKLMVLEEQHFNDFQRLFDWQLGTPGPIPELAAAEDLATATPASLDAPAPSGDDHKSKSGPSASRRTPTAKPKPQAKDAEPSDEVRAWASKHYIARWLRLEPRLGRIDLGPYFTYSRDRLSFGVAVSRLAPHLQELLIKAQSETSLVRRTACNTISELPADDRAQLMAALVELLQKRPSGTTFLAAIELAERAPDTLATVCDVMMRIPPEAVPRQHAQQAVVRLPPSDPMVLALLDHWEASSALGLKAVINTARQAQRNSGKA